MAYKPSKTARLHLVVYGILLLLGSAEALLLWAIYRMS
jgi:hypothetical protein